MCRIHRTGTVTRLVDDVGLRRAFKRGERSALEEVYRAYVGGVYALVRGELGASDTFEVDNVVQEVFVRAFSESARDAYDGLRPYRNYLFTIARNLITDHRRKAKRVHVSMDTTGGDGAAVQLAGDERAPPDQALLDGEVRRLAAEFVAGLDDRQRDVFEARFTHGWSVERCARELAISEYRVKRTEKRLRKLFYEHMRRVGYFDGYSRARLREAIGVVLAASAGAQALIEWGSRW